jgi:TP901 family phage tail tape measure protein
MASNYDLGTARGQVVIDYDSKGPTRAGRDLDGLHDKGAKAAQTLGRTGVVMAAAGLAIAAGIGLAVKSAVSFEQRLSAIKAVSGATAGDMELVRSKALQLGKDTKFSANEAATAMEELAKAGISLPDILNGAADATVALAAAGEVSLPRAAEIAANAMNVFSLSAADMPKVADLIAGAANASAISVDEFAQSLQQSGAAAALVGVNFEDLTTAIALMGNAGIKGSDAGTSLKTFLQNLQPDTVKQTALFKKLGLVTKEGGNAFFDAAGHIKPMAQVAQVLQDSLKGMTDQQKQATLNTLFGSDAIRAAAIIAKGGAAGFDKLAGSIGKVTAQDVAKTRMDNLAGSIEQLKGSVETAGIVLGTILIPALRTGVDAVTGLLNAFLQLSPSAQSAALNIAGAASAFLIVAGGALKLISILRAARVAFALTWATALGPVAIIIAAVLAIAAAVFILYQRFQPVRTVVDAVGAALRTAFLAILPTINVLVAGVQNFIRVLQGTAAGGTGFVGIMGRLGAILRDVVIPAIIATGQFLATTFGPVITQIISIVSGFVTAIIGYFRSIQPQLTTIMNAIVAIIRFTFNLLTPIVIPILRFLLTFVIQTLQLLAIGIRLTLAGIANIFRGVFNIIGGIFKIFISLITGQWGAALQGLLQVAKGIWQLIKGIFQTILGVVIIAIVVTSVRAIGSVFRAGFNAVRSVVTGSINAVRGVISGGMAAARSVVSGAISAIRAVFGTLNAIRGIVSGIFNGINSIIGSLIGRAAGILSGGISRMVGVVSSIGGRMFAAGAEIVGRLIGGLTSRLGGLIDIANKVAGAIAKVIPGSPVRSGPLRVLNRGMAGKKIVQMLVDGITSQQSMAVASVSNLVGGMNAELDGLARTQALGLMASVGVSGAVAGASGRLAGVGGSTVTSGTSAGRVVNYNATVNNPPPVSGEKQVLDALSKIEILHNPLGVFVG